MALFVIGLGLGDANDITLKGLELAKKADKVYLESYTSVMNTPVAELEKLIGKKIILANREMVEQKPEQTILQTAADGDAALLVIGDPLVATTHQDIIQRATKLKVKVQVVHNSSVISCVGATGLQAYKFGKTTSLAFGEPADTPYNILAENQSIGAHTLFLLDLKPAENKFMKISDAIDYLWKLELKHGKKIFTKDTLCIGCARLGAKDQIIKAGKAHDIAKLDFGKEVHCLIVPGKMHFMEEEFIQQYQ